MGSTVPGTGSARVEHGNFSIVDFKIQPQLSRIRCQLGDEGAIMLATTLQELPALKMLRLDGNGIGDKGAVALVLGRLIP